jgi:branched-chain amino acid aminotransferase
MDDVSVWMNGTFVDKADASVSVFDHGLLYGDGVFEGIRAYDGIVFKLEEHVERLFKSAKVIDLDIPMTEKEVIGACVEACRKNDVHDGYIRLVVTRGVGDLGLDPDKCDDPTVFIIAADIELYPEEIYDRGLELVTVPTRRNQHEAINPRVKSLNYLNNIMGKMEAKEAGYEEGIMLNEQGYVVECTGDNIFVVESDDRLRTPPPYMGALEGITRASLMEIAERKGFEVVEEPLNRYDLYVADEIFVTGTAAEALPVIEIDGRSINGGTPGPVVEDLIDAFRDYVSDHGTPIEPSN